MQPASTLSPAAGQRRLGWRRSAALALAGAALLCAGSAHAATLIVCRTIDLAAPVMASLTIPAGSLFRDDGRADDPLAAFNGDKWQLRLETVDPVVIPPLYECGRVLVRVTGDSSVKSVSATANRRFVYAGSSLMLDAPDVSEELLTVKARVLDSVP